MDIQWAAQTWELFRDMMQYGPPEAFRESATKAIREQAERNAIERKAAFVETEDLVQACLTETPAPFRSRMLEDLARRGIDSAQYSTERTEIRDNKC